MTDPIDHTTRLREIEARAAEAERTGYTRSFDRAAPADLRYLLDRVRALEAALGDVVGTWDECLPHINGATTVAWAHGWLWAGPPDGMRPAIENARALLPAPETVETQG